MANFRRAEEARDTLKNIIIHLQGQVISNLKIAWQEDASVDFLPLQDVSDDSQDRTILCLMQLHQRLLVAAPITEMNYSPPQSAQPTNQPMIQYTNQATNQQMNHSMNPPMVQPLSQPIKQPFHGFIEPASRQQTWATQGSSQSPIDSGSRSSTGLSDFEQKRPSRFPFGRKPKPIPEGPDPRVQEISNHMNESPPLSNTPPKELSYNSAGRNGFGLGVSPPERSLFSGSRTSSVSTGSSFSIEPDHAESNPTFNPWNDIPGPRPVHRESRSSTNSQPLNLGPDVIPSHTSGSGHRNSQASNHSWMSGTSQPNNRSNRNSQGSLYPPQSPLGTTTQSSAETVTTFFARRPSERSISSPQGPPIAQHIVLPKPNSSSKGYLPAEDNDFAGFCKGVTLHALLYSCHKDQRLTLTLGAWRLQIGEKKKAIEEIKRPGSMFNSNSFWKCTKCHYEGRMAKDANGNKSVDLRPYGYNGLVYRWAFLFKSHVHLKEALPNPLESTFGCVFCCAEGRGTPIYGGVKNFLAHMQEHRERIPVGEVLYRMSCIVGRTPSAEEDFDIALPGI